MGKSGELVVENISLKKGDFTLKDISFNVPEGEILSIVGKSGSGKSLLLKSIAGLDTNVTGEIWLGSKKIDSLEPKDRNLGFVFEDYALFPNMNAKDNIIFPLEIHKKDKEEIEKSLLKISKEVGIDKTYLKENIDQLPEGIKQLVSLAKAKIRDIDIMLLDEPFTQLDKNIKDRMKVFLKKVIKRYGLTAIFALNDIEIAMALSEHLCILEDGELIQYGKTLDVYNNPNSPIALEITSKLGVNDLSVKIKDNIIEDIRYKLDNINMDIKEGNFRFMFRVEDVELDDNGIKANILSKNYYNTEKDLFTCKLENGEEVRIILPKCKGDSFRFKVTRYFIFE